MSLQLKYYDIWDEAREEGLEEGRSEGMKEGIKEGKLQQLFELVSDGDLPLEKAVQKTPLTREEFMKLMDAYNNQ